jgi:hypothetical protein
MNLLDLPLELLRAVLAEAILARTLKRALRLRLVNSKPTYRRLLNFN